MAYIHEGTMKFEQPQRFEQQADSFQSPEVLETDFKKLIEKHFAEENDRSAIRQALDLAKIAHQDQFRDEGTPYIVHPLRVAKGVIEMLKADNHQLVEAALLHDVLEDSELTHSDLKNKFGERVAGIVSDLSKRKWLTKSKGIKEYHERLKTLSTETLLIKLLDRLDNLRYLHVSPVPGKKKAYINETKKIYLPIAEQLNPEIHQEMLKLLGESKKEKDSMEVLADELDAMQQIKNNGRGVDHIKAVISFLKTGDVEKAKATCFNESDKYTGLEDIKELLKRELFQGKNHPWEIEERLRGNKSKPESQEKFEQVELSIKEPSGGRNWNIQYESDSLGTCAAYDSAIEEVAKRENLQPFHQEGRPHTPGKHMWEFWAKTKKENLEALIEEIHKLAKEKFEAHKEMQLHDLWKQNNLKQ